MSAGILCLEGDWSRDLAKAASVEPMLRLLTHWNPHYVPYIHRNVSTPDGLKNYLTRWLTRRYNRYPILYIACHGTPGVVCLDHDCRVGYQVSLDSLEETLAGRCQGRVLYFGSCGTLRTPSERLETFLRTTGALAVLGYARDVDWLSSTAFELLVLGAMQRFGMTTRGMGAVRRQISRQAAGLEEELSFRMLIRRGRPPKPPRKSRSKK